jgi:heme/copper-type cytochrome/quinol oxidase subunit 2
MMNRFGVVLAVGVGWFVVAIALCAWLVPADAYGYYLVNHGRAEHHASRWGAVSDLALVGVVLIGVAVVILVGSRRAPTRAVLGAAPLLLLSGLLPLIVTLASRHPGQGWFSWLVLSAIALGVLAPVLGPAAHSTWRARRSQGPRA